MFNSITLKGGKTKRYGDLLVDEVYEYDIDSTSEELMHGVRITTSCSISLVLTILRIQRSLWKATSVLLLFCSILTRSTRTTVLS